MPLEELKTRAEMLTGIFRPDKRQSRALVNLRKPSAYFSWRDSWRDGIYDFLHYHSRAQEVLGIARGTVKVRFGGAKGRNLSLKAGDVIIQAAGIGHQRIAPSEDLVVVGAYPAGSTYDECRATEADHDRALRHIAETRAPRTDPVYGAKGPLKALWH